MLINELQSSVFIYDDILFKGNCVEMKMAMLMECTVIYSIYLSILCKENVFRVLMPV